MINPVLQNLEELWAAVNEEWSKIESSVLTNLINNMPITIDMNHKIIMKR